MAGNLRRSCHQFCEDLRPTYSKCRLSDNLPCLGIDQYISPHKVLLIELQHTDAIQEALLAEAEHGSRTIWRWACGEHAQCGASQALVAMRQSCLCYSRHEVLSRESPLSGLGDDAMGILGQSSAANECTVGLHSERHALLAAELLRLLEAGSIIPLDALLQQCLEGLCVEEAGLGEFAQEHGHRGFLDGQASELLQKVLRRCRWRGACLGLPSSGKAPEASHRCVKIRR
mmetsp:Transcript_132908/g.284072  ORF Transcript_132908/g.284072 Transcript_132908/m.284072 type:complete len:230 (-) Transcript_132908:682-1371(-)